MVLSSPDGGLRVEGELIAVEGELFRLRTEAGEITLDGGALRCAGAACPAPETLLARADIAGPAGMIHNLMPALLEVFAEREGLDFKSLFLGDDRVIWDLRARGSDRLVAQFRGRVVAEAQAVKQLRDGAAALALGRLAAAPPVRQDVIALDAVVPLVAPENPRAMVTQTQLAALLSGATARWSRLGGEDLPVVLHHLEGARAPLRRWSEAGFAVASTREIRPEALSDAVAADPAALGIGLYSAIGNAAPLVVSGACGLAIPATRDTIRAEDYPLTQPLFLQRIGADQPKILRDFIAFARSFEAQPVIAATGYVDQAIGQIGFDRQGDRIANAVLAAGEDAAALASVQEMIGALLGRSRLTLTFRFRDGSSELDAQSASNVGRLAEAISSGMFDGTSLYFIGFSDGIGPADGNQRLSMRRARAVRRAVAALADGTDVALKVDAYGERLPMACDDSAWGREVNRRVEVWIE
ncbi:MAG: OmpA family protein [Silicimonas sp.]|nr:OmpA family protein [Silicimonas sp.]